jgi:hypothetical protein
MINHGKITCACYNSYVRCVSPLDFLKDRAELQLYGGLVHPIRPFIDFSAPIIPHYLKSKNAVYPLMEVQHHGKIALRQCDYIVVKGQYITML